jgi:hypothetical protein
MPTIPRANTSHRRRARFLSSYLRRSRPRTRAKQFPADSEPRPEFPTSWLLLLQVPFFMVGSLQTEQCSDNYLEHGLNRSIKQEVLPVCQKYGTGALVWSPLAKGMLTGRYRKGQALPEACASRCSPSRCPTSATWKRSSDSSPSRSRPGCR